MKIVDVKVGQILKDKFGNKYEVVKIDENDNLLPLKLKCIKFVKKVRFSHAGNIITKVGSYAWCLQDYSKLLSSNSTVGEFLKQHFLSDLTKMPFDDINIIDINVDDIYHRFLFGDIKYIEQIEITLKDLLIDDNENYPTKDNVRLDDIIVDKNGVEYTVISRDSSGIGVK